MNLTSEVLDLCTSDEKSIHETNLQKTIERQKIINITIPSFQQLVDQLNRSIIRDTEVMNRAEEDMRNVLKRMSGGSLRYLQIFIPPAQEGIVVHG